MNDFHRPSDTSLTKKSFSQSSASFDAVVTPVLIGKHCLIVPNKMGTEPGVSVHADERFFKR